MGGDQLHDPGAMIPQHAAGEGDQRIGAPLRGRPERSLDVVRRAHPDWSPLELERVRRDLGFAQALRRDDPPGIPEDHD